MHKNHPNHVPDTPQHVPWYESNLLWGPIGMLWTLVPVTKHIHLWMLWPAWVCFALIVWWRAGQCYTRFKWVIRVLGIVVISFILYGVEAWLSAPSNDVAVRPFVKQSSTPDSSKVPAESPKQDQKQPNIFSNISKTQPAARNEQTLSTVKVSGNLSQSTNAPCSGNSVTGNVDNSGCQVGIIPPQNRAIQQGSRESAVKALKTAQPGSRVYFIIIGGGREISNFENSLEQLFSESGWTIAGRSFIGQLSVVAVGGSGAQHSEGSGLNCLSRSGAGSIALEALKIAGYPCNSGPISSQNENADVFIQIGSRILSED